MTEAGGGTIVFVDDEEHLRLAAEQTLTLADLEVILCDRAEAALEHLDRDFPGILVTDIRMPKMDGLDLMRAALARDPDLPVILVTGHGDVDLAVRSMQEGAWDFIEKPYAPARLTAAVARALDKRRLTMENRRLRAAASGDGRAADAVAARLTGQSEAMRTLRERIRATAATEADVLIEGATGTGKEEVARALHEASARSERPFVQVNCAALPDGLIESELFGHESGAFPGATRARYGKFEHARGGTVFLDEIDSLPLPLQAKLLQAIQNRQVTRLGSNETVDLDVRFVAASKRDLEAAAASGEFRADLLYRLNVVTIRVPGLDERREDIPILFLTLLAEAARRNGRALPDVPASVLAALAARDWPGHVRELRNAAERHALGLEAPPPGSAEEGRSLAERMAAHEKAQIAAALAANAGSVKATYEALGLSRKSLYEKMQKHGLDRTAFRQD
ncbi:sigma-54 dependent transcriptional regulator [Roseibacterium sp. SDUM158017]|uniref:sigma-54-dependent transcriptional regulator n=1 Tax=Roseicyclus salinarum TaxID=3036773 RepID=UPI002414E411|nr:sigma-54 dependent transcriptional regulator [Roseibacterium sp. SDUM158017]MDG4647179.1 sigma-54 dependent transcriptional regulator [Roseibacterium sp. SDUM158017]